VAALALPSGGSYADDRTSSTPKPKLKTEKTDISVQFGSVCGYNVPSLMLDLICAHKAL
jgi:hypothetical protein